jgi:hypothetical protein
VASERNSQTVSFEELAYSNMLSLNALVELLAEKGLVSKQEVLERVKQLQAQTQLRKRHNNCGNKGSSRLFLALPKNPSPQPTVSS